MEEEIWKDIKHFEGFYKVSNLGNVKSLDRYINKVNGKQFIKGRLLTPRVHSGGYLRVQLSGKDFYIHRIVAEAFIYNENDLPQVNHIDGDKENNNVYNLEWCSESDNIKHAHKTGLFKTTNSIRENARRVGKADSKKVGQYSIDGEFIKEFNSLTEASESVNTSVGNIGSCCNPNKKQKTAKGYIWKYIEKEV